jgi:hypothetical protein
LGVQPKKILEKLRQLEILNIKKTQIYSLINSLRRKKYGEGKKSLGKLEAWCQENYQTINDDEDKLFVIGSQISNPLEGKDEDLDFESPPTFRVVILTKRL